MDLDVKVQNLGELKRDLSRLYGKLNKKDLAKLLKPGASIFRKAVKNRAPVGHGPQAGALKRAIRVRTARGKASDPYAAVDVYFAKTFTTKSGKKVKPYYALFVHNGTVAHPTKRKHKKPRLFSNGEERAYQRQRLGENTIRIQPNPFVADAFEAEAQRVATVILSNIENAL